MQHAIFEVQAIFAQFIAPDMGPINPWWFPAPFAICYMYL